MNRRIKRIVYSVLCCTLAVCICAAIAMIPVSAENATGLSSAEEAADKLYELGLFKGVGFDSAGNPIFDLERTPNRHEALTMLVRLLGKEAVAEKTEWVTPFTDVAVWAKPYVGYAYNGGIAFGTSKTTYSGDAETTVTQYLTFMLRTLGYSSEKDFEWDKAWVLSDKIGMTHGEYNASTAKFTRGDMAIIAYSALSCNMTSGKTLYDYLQSEGAIKSASKVWDKSGKTPDQYTWAEFEALSEGDQEAFFEWFSTAEAFEAWMNKAQGTVSTDKLPWENGGKKPNEYTMAEFEALSEIEQEAFFEWFSTAEAFEAWMSKAKGEVKTEEEIPPDSNDKDSDEYTWAEFEAMSEVEQEAFFESFPSAEAFEAWMSKAQEETATDALPWENGGKTPDKYTWEEFEALSDILQEEFFNWFSTPDDFAAWAESVGGDI